LIRKEIKMAKLVVGMFSGGVDRLTAAGVIMSGAAADDMDIEVFVLLMAARSFKKEVAEKNEELSESPGLKEQFFAGLDKNNVKKWTEFMKEVKELTNVKIHICGLAGKIWDGTKLEDFIDLADDICGINEYITAAQEADMHVFI
jgi:peroxiredoxin family protein